MSIIHDALKKAQQSLSKNNGETPSNAEPPAQAAPSPVQPQPAQNIWATPQKDTPKPASEETAAPSSAAATKTNPLTLRNILIILVSAVVILVCISFVVQQFTTSTPGLKQWVTSVSAKARRTVSQAKAKLIKKNAAAPSAKPLASVTLPAEAARTSSSAVQTAPPTLNIHGIMSRGATNVALINDNVYQEGDEIQGVKILKINMNSIVVQDNGQEKTIRIKK